MGAAFWKGSGAGYSLRLFLGLAGWFQEPDGQAVTDVKSEWVSKGEKKLGLTSVFFPGAFFLPLNFHFLIPFSSCVNSQGTPRETHNCF